VAPFRAGMCAKCGRHLCVCVCVCVCVWSPQKVASRLFRVTLRTSLFCGQENRYTTALQTPRHPAYISGH
jgi:hypothetical protein